MHGHHNGQDVTEAIFDTTGNGQDPFVKPGVGAYNRTRVVYVTFKNYATSNKIGL